MMKQYDNIDEFADEIKSNVPEITYKYRSWDDDNHKSMLTNNLIWFAHPKDLNDPYDIRIPVRFDYNEVNDPKFLEKLRLIGERELYWLSPDSRDFRIITGNRLELIKKDPEDYFEKNYLQLRDSDVYDQIGVFSLTADPLNETMWAYYGMNSKGFCVGFKTYELARDLQLGFGMVNYDETPPLYSFIKDSKANYQDGAFLKHTKWQHEEEFRILTFNIRKEKDRLKSISEGVIEEVIVGEKISDKNLNEIMRVIKSKFKNQIKLFQAVPSMGYGYKKKVINI